MATLLSAQPRVLLAACAARAHCWLVSSSLSTRNSGPVGPGGPQPVPLQRGLPSQAQGFAFFLVKFRKSPVDYSSSLPLSLWMAAPPSLPTGSPQLGVTSNHSKSALRCLLQVTGKTFNMTGARLNPCSTFLSLYCTVPGLQPITP